MFLFICKGKKGITMSNPFAINPYNAYAQNATPVTSTYVGGSSAGGTGSIWGGTPEAQGVSKTGGNQGVNSYQKDINEIAMIGANKRAGFENGLGGTNNPDDHKLFLTA